MYTYVYTVGQPLDTSKSREHGQGALYWVESRKMWRAVVDVGFDPATGNRLQKARMSKTTHSGRRAPDARRRKTGVGDSTVSGAHRTLVTMLEYARAERICTENVAMLTPPRRARPGKAGESLTREEARALLAIGDARWTMGLLTGLRSGEARALRREDVDLTRGIAELSWSLTDATFVHGCGGMCGKKRAGNCPQRPIEISDDLEWQLLPLSFGQESTSRTPPSTGCDTRT